METPDKEFSELVDRVKSWIPRRPAPPNVSRDFWMPDKSCRVCYECDSQFTILNRRHHCRCCGRIFCAKCTSNFVPAISDGPSSSNREEGERIRACNFCFKQWEQDISLIDNGILLPSPVPIPLPSATSLAGTKSTGTGNSTCSVGSMLYPTGSYQCVSYASLNPHQSTQVDLNSGVQEMVKSGRNLDSVMDTGDPSPNQFGFCMDRSDDDDDEYGTYRLDCEGRSFQQSDSYFGRVEFEELGDKFHPDDYLTSNSRDQQFARDCDATPSGCEVGLDARDLSSPRNELSDSHVLNRDEKLGEAEAKIHGDGDECSAASPLSPLYGSENLDNEAVDFENNGLLWFPPEPEDVEDEREAAIFAEDDEDATCEWGYLQSGSFGSGQYRSRDRSSEEHGKAMKNVVDSHFRALVSQLLQVENLAVGEENGKESWLEIITSLSWEAATLLKPDTSKEGGMDPGGYVKVKCIACGRRGESMVVKGVVCKKNVAHRRMRLSIANPRLLILGGALEYQRVANHFSSVDTLLQQEMDHLKMAVTRIEAHHPTVLLVEKSVSRFAQDYLLTKDISLILNIKRPLLERIARCTGAQIVPSIDHLSSPKLGHCEQFHVGKFVEEHGSAGQAGKKLLKTLMFLEGCPKPLGYTILLKGANGDELKKVKHVIQYGIFAAYHLALETSFLADEGASLPELPLKSPITVALPDKPLSIDRSISTVPGFSSPSSKRPQMHGGTQIANKVFTPNPAVLSRNPSILKAEVAVSPSVSSNGVNSPYTGSNHFVKSVNLNHSPCDNKTQAQNITDLLTNSPYHKLNSCAYEEKNKVAGEDTSEFEQFTVEGSRMIKNQWGYSDFASFNQEANQHDGPVSAKEDFPPSPSDHQSILVSLSTRCVWKGTVCERAHLFRIKYYGSFDKPLGRFLRDHLFDQGYQCRSCEMPSEAHVHCYTHRQGSLTISVKKLPEFLLPGERDDKIWMWHRCLRCPRTNGFPPATRRVVMSEAAWGLSFGKFLELSFSNHAAASRVASCGHSLHRDCLRFYGFGKMVACFRYASIDVHSVYLPPSKLCFDCKNQGWIEKETSELVGKAELLFVEVFNSLHQIAEKAATSIAVLSQDSKHRILELEAMLQKEKAEFEESLQKALKKELQRGQPVADILEINSLRRQLLFHSYVWDHRLLFLDMSLKKPSTAGLEKTNLFFEINRTSKHRSFTSSEVLLSDAKVDDDLKGILYPVENLRGFGKHIDNLDQPVLVNEKDPHHGKEYQRDISSSPSVRRVLSEGQFPIMANLSDTFDSAWTGEMAQDGDSMVLKIPIEATRPMSKLEHFQNPFDLSGTETMVQSCVPSPSPKRSDGGEDSARWFAPPFLNFYRAYNKKHSGGAGSRSDTPLADYNPVYISSFRELKCQGGARLLLPAGVNDMVIPIYDEEPTSIISYALASHDYHLQMSDEYERLKDSNYSSLSLSFNDSMDIFYPLHSLDETTSDSLGSLRSSEDWSLTMSGSRSSLVLDPLLYTKSMHVRVSFNDDGPLGKVKYTVICYYAKRFDALRRNCCPNKLDFIRSLSRCKKWGAQGGKSNVFFAKTLDDRFIAKQVTKTELESFIKFGPEYFKYLSDSIGTGSPTCLAKILGIYQVATKNLKGGKETRMDILVLENLTFGRNITRLYDLKGSSRSRYNPDSSGSNKVLLDQNLIEAMPTSPIFVGNKAKRLLERAVWNDTSFLASIDVMDYSLLVGVDEEKHELVLGIIDFMRQYTWDKHLETWVKASGILGGPKNASPTVISPKQYKKRFRKAMSMYFLMVPDQWSPPTIIPSESQTSLRDEN